MKKIKYLLLFLSMITGCGIAMAQDPVPSNVVQLTTNTPYYQTTTGLHWYYNGTTYLWYKALGVKDSTYYITPWYANTHFAPIGGGVTSFNTRTGAVVPLVGDYSSFYPLLNGTGATGTWNIGITGNAGTATKLFTARAINGVNFDGSSAITITSNTPNAVTFNNIGTGASSGTTFDGSVARTISYNTIGAEPTISSGTTAQYYRGDKTFQTLNTAAVPELTNLYYTDARSRAALSFAAGSGAYNNTTGVITIPTNNNQITNGAGYITGNQIITFAPTGDVTGSTTGTTTLAPALSIGAGKVTNAMLAGNIDLTTKVTGVLPVANGGTNASSAGITALNNITGRSFAGFTGGTTGNLVSSLNPTFTSTTTTAAITTGGTSNSTFYSMANLLAPGNNTAGNASFIQIGTSSSAGNAMNLGLIYQGNNSASNRFWFGVNGTATPVFSYYNNGEFELTRLSTGVAHIGSTGIVASSLITPSDLAASFALPNGTTATTQSAGDNSTKVATTGYVDASVGLYQPLSSKLTSIAGLANARGVLTNNGSGVFSYGPDLKKVQQVYSMGNSLTANGIYSQKLDTLLGSQWYVVNKGIQGQTTTNMLARFTTDVTSHTDCRYVTILGGINDVIAGSTALTIESNLQSMYTQAHNAGIKVVGITLLPFKGNVNWTSGKQAVLDSVNTWIKNTATNIDYKVDAYAVFNDPANPGMMLPQYYGTSPDYLHPNLAGYLFLGTTIYNNVTWTPNTTPVTLGIADNTSINQNLRTNDAPTFRDLNLVAQQPSYGGGVFGGGNLYMPTSTSTTGIIYNNAIPVIQFPGTGNVQVGYSDVAAFGNYNTKIGHEAGNSIGTGTGNASIGSFSFYNRSGADYGVAVGYQAGFTNNSSRSVFLGPQAGFYETGGSKLFIDNQSRSNEADGRVKALIYGIFDAAVSNQELHFNATTSVNGNFSATNLSGNGSLLTALTPANISAGTAPISITGNAVTVTNGVYTTTFNSLGDARYPLLTGSNTLTGTNTNVGDLIVKGTNNTTNWFSAIKLHRFGSSTDFLTISTKDRTLGNSPVYFNDGNGNGIEWASSGVTKMALSTNGELSVTGAFNASSTQTTVSGSTSGSIVCSQPFQGSSYKKVLIYVNNLTSTALTYTYPVAFTFNPMLSFATTGTVSPTSDATHITISGSGGGGWITLEGY